MIKIVCKLETYGNWLMKEFNEEEIEELMEKLDDHGRFLLSVLKDGDTVFLRYPTSVLTGDKWGNTIRCIDWHDARMRFLNVEEVADFLNENGTDLINIVKQAMNAK